MEKALELLEDLASLDMDDDGDFVLFAEHNWHERIIEARDELQVLYDYECQR